MGIPVHTIDQLDGSNFSREDRVLMSIQTVASAAGSGAGASVTTAVAMNLPANYVVFVDAGQDATAYVAGKTTTGFNVVLEPRLAANTLAAGTFDVLVVA